MWKKEEEDCRNGCLWLLLLWGIGLIAYLLSHLIVTVCVLLGIVLVCALLYALHCGFEDIVNNKTLKKVAIITLVTLGILLAIILCMVFCANVFPNYFKLIMAALLFISFIVFSILQIIKSRKGKKTDSKKPENNLHPTIADSSIQKEYVRITKEFPNGLKVWYESIKSQITIYDDYPQQVVDNESTIQHLEKEYQEKEAFIRVRFEIIQRKYPHGYDEWYNSLPISKRVNSLEWAVKEEQIISHLEQDYFAKLKKEKDDIIAQDIQLQKLLSEYNHIISEYHNGFSKWRNSHPDLSDTERMDLAIKEKDKIIQLEEEHLKGDYDRIVERYPHGWHKWERTINKDEIESFLCLAVKNEKTIKQLEEEWQEQKEINDFNAHYTDKQGKLSLLNTICGIPYYYYFNYYSKEIYPDINSKDRRARQYIWNFKDGKIKISGLLYIKIVSIFDYRRDKFTFVCIPASTKETTQRRYKYFMERVCQKTGMLNGYDYVIITKETTPKRLGGTEDMEYECDKEFFKGRNVIVFDDVLTRGHSLEKMVEKLEKVGAKVWAAFFLGQTYYNKYRDYVSLPHPWDEDFDNPIVGRDEEEDDDEELIEVGQD